MLFKELGIAGVSAKYRNTAEVKAAKEQAQEQDELASAAAAGGQQRKKTKGKAKAKAQAVGHSGRGASDHFLLEASLEGVATEILRDHSTVRAHVPMRPTSVSAVCA